jgi:hypothetical protein
MTNEKYDYIKLDYSKQPNEMVCERCKKTQVLPAGAMPFKIFLANTNAFYKLHKGCKG